ncbi:hypothetical protein [Tenacibaculum mesophilum]|uniref:hypothetical protein n=1 Tax=Tenacibaculum mesophilum TaxID=104268 RepID=UPI00064B1A72|nr:hypothetical protein [Tenacibaculum mesophilum]
MARKTKEEIQDLKARAKLYYLHEGITNQKDLAQRVGVTEKTIGNWIEQEKWKKLKRNFLVTREELMADYLEELVEIKNAIKAKPEGERFADFKQAQIRRSLIKDIEALETDAQLPDIISAMTQLLNFVRKDSLEKAQETSHIIDAFIKHKLRS